MVCKKVVAKKYIKSSFSPNPFIVTFVLVGDGRFLISLLKMANSLFSWCPESDCKPAETDKTVVLKEMEAFLDDLSATMKKGGLKEKMYVQNKLGVVKEMEAFLNDLEAAIDNAEKYETVAEMEAFLSDLTNTMQMGDLNDKGEIKRRLGVVKEMRAFLEDLDAAMEQPPPPETPPKPEKDVGEKIKNDNPPKEEPQEPPQKKKKTVDKGIQTDRKIEKAFVCPHCDMIFNRKFNRNRHVYLIHEKRSRQLAEVVAKAEEDGREKAMKEMCKPTVRVLVYYNDECVASTVH